MPETADTLMISRPLPACCMLMTPVVTPFTWFGVVPVTVFPAAVMIRPSVRNSSWLATKFGNGTPERAGGI